MRWYAVLFWGWVIGSAAVWLWRRMNHKPSANPPTTEVMSSPLRLTAADPADTTAPRSLGRDTESSESRSVLTNLPTLLAGVSLPCGLAPLTHGQANLNFDSAAVFATDSASFEETKKKLLEEISGLGFEIVPIDQDTFRAHKPEGDLEIEFFGTTELNRDFSTATNGATVVEIRLAT